MAQAYDQELQLEEIFKSLSDGFRKLDKLPDTKAGALLKDLTAQMQEAKTCVRGGGRGWAGRGSQAGAGGANAAAAATLGRRDAAWSRRTCPAGGAGRRRGGGAREGGGVARGTHDKVSCRHALPPLTHTRLAPLAA